MRMSEASILSLGCEVWAFNSRRLGFELGNNVTHFYAGMFFPAFSMSLGTPTTSEKQATSFPGVRDHPINTKSSIDIPTLLTPHPLPTL